MTRRLNAWGPLLVVWLVTGCGAPAGWSPSTQQLGGSTIATEGGNRPEESTKPSTERRPKEGHPVVEDEPKPAEKPASDFGNPSLNPDDGKELRS